MAKMRRVLTLQGDRMRDRLKDAFLSIYETVPLSKISIKMISERAGVSRGTFYCYYEDIFDLLSELENEMLWGLTESSKSQELLDHLKTANDKGALISLYTRTLSFIAENSRTMNILYHGSDNNSFRKKLMDKEREKLSKVVQSAEHLPASQYAYAIEYIANGSMATYMMWVKNGMKESKEEMSDLIMSFMAKCVLPPPIVVR